MKIAIPEPCLHEGQMRIVQQRRKRNVACMGRRWGKTVLMQGVLCCLPGGALSGKEGSGKTGYPTAWYAPNDSYFTNVFQGIARAYAPVIKRANTSPRPVIEFKNGGSIEFWTLENPMKCGRGNHYARVVIDEAAHARYLQDAWELSIEYTLADLDGDAWFISTPFGMNYFHDLFQRGMRGDKDWVSHTEPSHNNPYLPDGWMEAKRKDSPERRYRQEVLAEFLADGAGVFRGVDRAPECAWLESAEDTGWQPQPDSYVIGADWGRHNDFTVFTVLNDKGHVVHLDRFTDIGYELQVGRLKALWQRFNRCPILAESNSMGGPLIERLQREQVNVRAFNTTASSKAEAIEALALALENGQIALPPHTGVDVLKRELIAYDQERLPSGQIRYGAPKGQHDDCVMSLAIAWHGMHLSRPQPVSFSVPSL